MIKPRMQRAIVIAFFALVAPQVMAASTAEKTLGAFGAWKAYIYKENGQTVCYMVATKTIQSNPAKKRGQPYLMITHRPVEASTDVISYGAGTALNERRGARLKIGDFSYDLFSVRDTAWARDALTDHKIAAAMRKNPIAQVIALPANKKSIPLSDRFDLTGAEAAYHAIGKACGLPAEPAPKKAAGHKKKAR